MATKKKAQTTKKIQATKKEGSFYLVLYIGVAFLITVGVIIGVIIHHVNKQDTTVQAQHVDTVIETENELQNIIDKKIEATNSDADIEEIMHKALLGIETYSYTAYCQIDTYWNKEVSEEEFNQLVAMGGSEDSFKGISILGVVGNVTPTKTCLTVLSQHDMMNDAESRSTQTFFDYINKKSYSQTNNLITQKTTDWTVSDITSDNLLFENFFNDIKLWQIKEDDQYYYIDGLYDYNSTTNNMNMIIYYILSTYDLSLEHDIPVTVVIDKTTLQVRELVYNLNELLNKAIKSSYDIKNVQLKVNITDINTTEVVIPEELQNKLK